VAKSPSRRRIRNVFGTPPSAVPRETPRPAPPKRIDPGFDIDAVRVKPPKPATSRRRKP
jgi:hypothetical protein